MDYRDAADRNNPVNRTGKVSNCGRGSRLHRFSPAVRSLACSNQVFRNPAFSKAVRARVCSRNRA
jgi:hypothetical protein